VLSLTELDCDLGRGGSRNDADLPETASGRRLLMHDGEIGEILIALPGYGIGVARTIDEKRGRAGDFGFSAIYEEVLDLVRPQKP